MIKEIWEHFAHPVVAVGAAATVAVGADSGLEEPYDQFDVFIDAQYQWSYDGLITWFSWKDGVPHTELLIISGQNGQPCRVRYGFAEPVKNIQLVGNLTNLNAANGIQATIHINTMRRVRSR